ncbi:hypothetical protein BTHE_1916 [Bifidobacterium thermophilum]|nr:hypothetical protein BTHE_1916 [Bifidobacterium thermophilum]
MQDNHALPGIFASSASPPSPTTQLRQLSRSTPNARRPSISRGDNNVNGPSTLTTTTSSHPNTSVRTRCSSAFFPLDGTGMSHTSR